MVVWLGVAFQKSIDQRFDEFLAAEALDEVGWDLGVAEEEAGDASGDAGGGVGVVAELDGSFNYPLEAVFAAGGSSGV